MNDSVGLAAKAMDSLVNECIKTGAPIGTLKLAYDNGDFIRVAEITSEYNLDPEMVKEAFPGLDWFKKKTRSMSELREEIRGDEQLSKEISARVKTFNSIYKEYLADLGDEKAAREKFSGEYGNRVPDAVLSIMRAQQTGDPASDLIIGLAVSTILLNHRSILMTKYYPDIAAIAKKIPGDKTDNLKAVIINILKPLVGANYAAWSSEIRKAEDKKDLGPKAPDWYAKVKTGLKRLEDEIKSGSLSKTVFSNMSESVFESNPSAVGFDVELKLVEEFLGKRVEEAVSDLPANIPSRPGEYNFRTDVMRDFYLIIVDISNAKETFSNDLKNMLMTALHNKQEGSDENSKIELNKLAKKWDKGLKVVISKAYDSMMVKLQGKVSMHGESVMSPGRASSLSKAAEEASAGRWKCKKCNEHNVKESKFCRKCGVGFDGTPVQETPQWSKAPLPPKKAEERLVVRIASKDVPKGLKKHWKEHFEGRPKGSFDSAVKKLKGKVDKPENLAAWLEHKSTGKWPSEGKKKDKKEPKPKKLKLLKPKKDKD